MKTIKILAVIFILSLGLRAQSSANLTWNLSPTPGVTNQLVCRSLTSGSENCQLPLMMIPNDTAITYSDTTGAPGTTYYYTLEACIGLLCSGMSNEASGTFPMPPAPQTGLTVTVKP